MLDLVWQIRVDGALCAEPVGLFQWYYITNDTLLIVDRFGYVVKKYTADIRQLKRKAQEHYHQVIQAHLN